MHSLLLLAPLLLASSVYGTSHNNNNNTSNGDSKNPSTDNVHNDQEISCDVTEVILKLPSGQNNISLPTNAKPKYIALGLGTQNYTCSSSGTYTNVGAFAELLDISCFVNRPMFSSMRKRAPPPDSDDVWEHEAHLRALLGPERLRLGMHTFEADSKGDLVPIFDFRGDSQKNDNGAFVGVHKTGSLHAPNATTDVDWLQLEATKGNLASHVYRVDTHFGQPPTTCQPGSPPIQVRYAAKYYFYQNTTSSGSSAPKTGSLNAQLASGSSDPDTLQKLLNYAPAMLGLLGTIVVLSLVIVGLGIATLLKGRRNSFPTRSTSSAYRPVQLPRAKPMEESYHDEPEPYGA